MNARDSDLTPRAHGEFIAPFKPSKTMRHLCFQASRPYTSWVCASLAGDDVAPNLSFVQLNAK